MVCAGDGTEMNSYRMDLRHCTVVPSFKITQSKYFRITSSANTRIRVTSTSSRKSELARALSTSLTIKSRLSSMRARRSLQRMNQTLVITPMRILCWTMTWRNCLRKRAMITSGKNSKYRYRYLYV